MPSCPRCGSVQVTRTGSHTERHGVIIDIDEFSCDLCGLDYEKRV
jgi:transposase-like protein